MSPSRKLISLLSIWPDSTLLATGHRLHISTSCWRDLPCLSYTARKRKENASPFRRNEWCRARCAASCRGDPTRPAMPNHNMRCAGLKLKDEGTRCCTVNFYFYNWFMRFTEMILEWHLLLLVNLSEFSLPSWRIQRMDSIQLLLFFIRYTKVKREILFSGPSRHDPDRGPSLLTL